MRGYHKAVDNLKVSMPLLDTSHHMLELFDNVHFLK